jgi:hypothetical protein
MTKKAKASTPPPVLRPQATTEGLTLHVALARSLLSFASTDPVRAQLTGIGIDVDPTGRGWVQATDGCTLARSRIDPYLDTSHRGAFWSTGYVEGLIAEARKTKSTHVWLKWDKTDQAIKPSPGHAVQPHYGIERDAACAISGEYLARVGSLSASLGKADRECEVCVVLRSYSGAYDPMRFDCIVRGDSLVEMIVMPMRVDLPAGVAVTPLRKRVG